MKMRKLPFIILSIVVFYGGLLAQTDCPTISLTGPSGITEPGGTITFNATVQPASKDLKYEWSISDGKLLRGEGTLSIEVETPKRDYNITATIEVRGLPAGCPKYESETAGMTIHYRVELLDEFRGPVTAKEKLRFKSVEIRLRNEPDFRVVVVLYYKNTRQREADKRMFLKYIHSAVKARVVFVNGPDRGDGPSIRVWLVPSGASDPAI
jgi:hypothetical protein